MSEMELGNLTLVDLAQVWKDEARDFTPWLAKQENLNRLAKELDLELEFEAKEVSIGGYFADIVAIESSSGTKVVVENQLTETDHKHLGQILTYASGLEATILIWIASRFREEHRRAVDYLNEKSAPGLRVYAVEIQLYKIGNSNPAPHFKTVASPNEYLSAIKNEPNELTENKSLYLAFWEEFSKYCQTEGFSLNLRKPRPQHWYSVAIGRSKFSLSLTASSYYKRIGCEVYIRGKSAKVAFDLLFAQKNEIEKETGELEWQRLDGGQDCRVVLFKEMVDVTDRNNWKAAHQWCKQEVEIFHKAFFEKIQKLNFSETIEI